MTDNHAGSHAYVTSAFAIPLRRIDEYQHDQMETPASPPSFGSETDTKSDTGNLEPVDWWESSFTEELLSEASMERSTEALEQAAKEGDLPSELWSSIHSTLVARIERNVFTEFPIPTVPPAPAPATSAPAPPTSAPIDAHSASLDSATSRHGSPGEGTSTDPQPVEPPAAAAFPPATSSDTTQSQEQASQSGTSRPVLPPDLQESFEYIRDTLINNFSNDPPHTVQRLAELILYPKQHHRFLPSYLSALERVVSVASTTRQFPLAPIASERPSVALVNGTSGSTASTKRDGDDDLGGALLTPIPWLQNARSRRNSSQSNSASSPRPDDGADRPTATEESLRDTGPVTQGELLRKEQELSDPPHAVGSAPDQENTTASQAAPTAGEVQAQDGAAQTNAEAPQPESEQPHARGPEEVGMEDIGAQQHATGTGQVLDMDAAVGRTAHRAQSPQVGQEEEKKDDAADIQAKVDAPATEAEVASASDAQDKPPESAPDTSTTT